MVEILEKIKEMNDFICKKETVKDILDYHELKCSNKGAYDKISNFLGTLPDYFPYNDFCGKLGDFVRTKMDRQGWDEDRFRNGLLERMRRYKVDADWKDLNAKIPKSNRAKRLRKLRKEKVSNIIKNNDLT